MSSERLTVTVEEAGRLLGVSRNSAYELARTGQLPTLRLGRRLLVPKAALEKMLAGASQPALTENA
jgi:excisionase family DNA binding protein